LEDTIDGLQVFYAASSAEALDHMASTYFHMAIVDVSLRGPNGEPDMFGGLHVLRRLRELRPSCERLLLTTVNEDRHEVLEAFFPEKGGGERLVDGFVDKMVTKLRAHEVVQDRAERWLDHQVELPGADQVLDHLASRGVQGNELSAEHGAVQTTPAEVESVLARLFGQGRVRPVAGIDTIDVVELEMISQGWSKSAVLWCEPSIGDRPGPRCLVKVGPREDSIQEIDRYESYVRFGLDLNQRVELLNSALGDTIGAACYTHADARGGQQRDLQHLFNGETDLAITALEELFDHRAQAWTADRSVEKDLAGFFVREYNKPLRHLQRGLRDFVERCPEVAFGAERTSVSWAGQQLAVPTVEDLGLATFSGSFEACVVHGDLHGGNVLVTETGQPVLIDYRNMGRGPRMLDFVSLEVSVRMASGSVSELEEAGADLVSWEREAWSADWDLAAGDRAPVATQGPSSGLEDAVDPYWRRVSSTIRTLARAGHPEVVPTEYAVTAVLRILRVMSAVAPEDHHRLRLLPFLSILTDVIRAAEDDG
ncbi:MAG: phosphotransferase, partial [Actinomycetota bacterium]